MWNQNLTLGPLPSCNANAKIKPSLCAVLTAGLLLAGMFPSTGATGFTGRVQNDTGQALDGVYLWAYGPTNTWTWADANGVYAFLNLPPGDYVLEVDPAHNVYHDDGFYRMYKPEWYDNEAFYSQAELIRVTAGQVVSNLDFSLSRYASIRGQVMDAGSGTPLSGVKVTAQSEITGTGDSTTTSSNGAYTLYVPAGAWRIRADPEDQPYSAVYYDNKDYLNADLVPVSLGQETNGIDFRLTRYTAGSLSGRVVAADGRPVSTVRVWAFGDEGSKSVYTGASGTYLLSGLKAGLYKVAALPSYLGQPYVDQYYCGQYEQQDAHAVRVIGGRETTNIDFNLIQGGTLRGQVRNARGNPIADVRVYLDVAGPGAWQQTTSDASGAYELANVVPGRYRVFADTGSSSTAARQYVAQYYSNRLDRAGAEIFTVNDGTLIPNLDFVLAVGARISGQALAAGGYGLHYHSVYAWSSAREEYYQAETFSGNFTLEGLPPGQYVLQPAKVYSPEEIPLFYQDKVWRGDADFITITNDETVSNIVLHTVYPGRIDGRITRGTTGMRDVWVAALTVSGGLVERDLTDNSGDYSIEHLPPGTYVVAAFPGVYNDENNGRYAYEFYGETRALAGAARVEVAASSTTGGININLDPANGRILGRAIRAAAGRPVVDEKVEAELTDGTGLLVAHAYTDANGNYALPGVPPGSFWVRIGRESYRHLAQYYNLAAGPDSAATVAVTSSDVLGIDFSLTEIVPGYTPQILAPVCSTADRPPVFTWTSVDEASVYELKVDDLTTGADDVIRVADIASTNYTPASLLIDNHRYAVTVRGGNSGGYGRWSSPVPFEQLPPPNYSLVLSTNGPGVVELDPAGGSYPQGTVVQLLASGVDGSRFDSWIGEVSNRFAAVTWVVMDSNKTVTAIFLPNQPTTAPVNSIPTNGSLEVGLDGALIASPFVDPDWDAVHAASQWQVNDPLGEWAYDSGPDALHLTNLPMALVGLEGNANYEWRVRYQDQHGLWSDWSEPTEFSTQNRLPLAPVCLDPAHNTTNASLQPILRSSSFADPDSKDAHAGTWMQVAVDPDHFESALFETNGPPTTAIPVPLGLLDYATYFWRVQHRDNHDGWSGWSVPARFTITVTIDAVRQLPAGGLELSWPTKTGWLYTLQKATNLIDGPWTDIDGFTDVPGTDAVLVFQDTSPAADGTYYRIAARPE